MASSRKNIEVRDGEEIKKRIREINKQKHKWLAQEQRRRPEAKITCSLITLNLDDLWRDHDVVDLKSFERIAPYL
tara:strand:- start:912 stop:1136 length:225 start_codon:yes stop_codon:yes gene_type:complete